MNFKAMDIIQIWTDSHGKTILKVFPTNKKVCVYCTSDLSKEAAKVCSFISMIVKQQWTFRMEKRCPSSELSHGVCYSFDFFPETVSLEKLFEKQKTPAKREKNRGGRQ